MKKKKKEEEEKQIKQLSYPYNNHFSYSSICVRVNFYEIQYNVMYCSTQKQNDEPNATAERMRWGQFLLGLKNFNDFGRIQP